MKKILFSLIALMLVVGLSLVYAVPVQADEGIVTAYLKDSNGNGLAGGVLKYYAPSPISGWVTVGTTDDSGMVSGSVSLPSGKTKTDFTMSYAGGSQKETGVDVTTNHPTLYFTTTPVTVKLETCDGTPLAGEARWNAGSALGGWLLIGTTPATKELLPGTYSFKVRYNYRENTKDVAIGTSATDVVFKTTNVSFWYSGTIYYYVPSPISGWVPFTSPMEMLPGSYDFKFGSLTSPTKTIIIGDCSVQKTIAFLLDSTGNGLAGGVLKYYAPSPISGWVTVGTATGPDGTVSGVVPNTKRDFTMYYAGGSQKAVGVNVTTNLILVFTTTPVTVKLETCSGTALGADQFGVLPTAYWYAGSALGGWLSIGTTPATKELLGNNTYGFKVGYGTRVNTVNTAIGTTPAEVVFKTTNVSSEYTEPIFYYANAPISGWVLFTSPTEMLPGNYDFKFGSVKSPTKTISISDCSKVIGP